MKVLWFVPWLVFLFVGSVSADVVQWRTENVNTAGTQVHLYFFWSPTCPHCKRARQYIEPLPQYHAWITLHSFDVVSNFQNAKLYQQMAASLGEQARSVPAFFICETLYVGWDNEEGMGQTLLNAAQQCRDNAATVLEQASNEIAVPLLGKVNAEHYSLPLFTLIIAGMDAFNPCAFFVLLFLLSLLVNARSRARMLLVGGCFVVVSGLVYFIFMAAWLNLFLVVGTLPWITLVAGVVVTIIGLFGVKDFIYQLKGPSLSISDSAKPKLFTRMRGLLSTQNLPTLLLGTITLALVANSYELLCTAGFPMVYTRTLTLHNLSDSAYYLYLVFYNIVYVVPLMVIVILFTVTLGARKLTLNEGRLLKLLSGSMMLGLGLVLIIRPERLSNVTTGIALLVFAAFVTLLAWLYLKMRSHGQSSKG